jgi:GH43 family beta-xylosidase
MYVIGGPPSNLDPTSSFTWEFLGPIRGLPTTQWAIDGTVIPLNNKNYFVYSGWPINDHSASELRQELYIAELSSPTTAASQAFAISEPTEPWEITDNHGINEGPQFLASPDGKWVGLAYSCAGSWTQDYKMNTLKYLGGDPLNRASWRKSRTPLLQKARGGPYGPGHGSFINEGGQTTAIFHATDRDNEGWDGRKARAKYVQWTDQGPKMLWTENGKKGSGKIRGFLSEIKRLMK